MNPKPDNDEFRNDQKIIQTLQEAVATSKRTLMDDGILLVCWGVALSLGFLWKYYNSVVLVASRMRDFMSIINVLVGIGLIAFTIYFIFFRKRGVRTYSALSTRFVWIGVIVAHNLNVIVIRNFIQDVNFELIHPLQMVLIGLALFVTGGIYRYYILSVSGIVMWIAAYLCVGYELNTQFLIRGITDFLCFAIPGVLMYAETKKVNHV